MCSLLLLASSLTFMSKARIRRFCPVCQKPLLCRITEGLPRIRNRTVKDSASVSQRSGLCPPTVTRCHSIIQSRGCASGYVNRHPRDTFRKVGRQEHSRIRDLLHEWKFLQHRVIFHTAKNHFHLFWVAFDCLLKHLGIRRAARAYVHNAHTMRPQFRGEIAREAFNGGACWGKACCKRVTYAAGCGGQG